MKAEDPPDLDGVLRGYRRDKRDKRDRPSAFTVAIGNLVSVIGGGWALLGLWFFGQTLWNVYKSSTLDQTDILATLGVAVLLGVVVGVIPGLLLVCVGLLLKKR